ncbi:SH3 domain-containing protein [Salinarimonas sp.]|uniref:SH3 domain-containing protein n=1 Tax=Salinarimonas sp. TaxID=2766526 RepID=UPI00391D0A63
MKSRLAGLLIAAAAAGVLALPGDAEARARAVVVTDLNMRAGPGTAYPVLAVLPAGLPVVVYGCVGDLSWCDVDVGWERGWVSARFLAEHDRRRPIYRVAPIITFEFGTYWDRWYSERDFYRERFGPPPGHWREDRGRGRGEGRGRARGREDRREEARRFDDFAEERFAPEPPPPPRRQREASEPAPSPTPTRPRGGALSGGDFFE